MAHSLSPTILLSVFAALIGLTILTVTLANVPLGAWEIWLSLGIASVKTGLVTSYFMHLRYDNPLFALIFLGSLFFVTLFLGITLMVIQALQQPAP